MPSDSDTAAADPELHFAEQAQHGLNAWWRYVLSIVMIVLVLIGSMLGLFFLGPVVLMQLDANYRMSGERAYSATLERFYHVTNGIDDWQRTSGFEAVLGFVINLAPFALALAMTLLLVVWLHKRPARTVLTGRSRFHWRGALVSLIATAWLPVFSLVLGRWLDPDALEYIFDPSWYFLFLPFVLVFVPLQVMAEEVVFRGYLLQLVGHVTRVRLLQAAVPTALFVLLHFANAEVAHAGIWAILYFTVIGLYLMLLAIRGNGLEYAFGFHLGLNLTAFSVISTSVSWRITPSIYLNPEPNFALGLPVIVLYCALHYWTAFRLLRRLA